MSTNGPWTYSMARFITFGRGRLCALRSGKVVTREADPREQTSSVFPRELLESNLYYLLVISRQYRSVDCFMSSRLLNVHDPSSLVYDGL